MTEHPAADLLLRAFHRIAHDMRNGLNALQMNNHLILHSELLDTERSVLEQNATTIGDLDTLVDLALLTADLQRGDIRTERARLDARAILRETTEELRALAPGRSIENNEPAHPVMVATDRRLLTWALRALALSGFHPNDDGAALEFGIERRGSEVALTVAGTNLRTLDADPLMQPDAWRGPVNRADLELSLAHESIRRLGGRIEVDANGQPQRWAVVLDALS